jgi:hypothetical protein
MDMGWVLMSERDLKRVDDGCIGVATAKAAPDIKHAVSWVKEEAV